MKALDIVEHPVFGRIYERLDQEVDRLTEMYVDNLKEITADDVSKLTQEINDDWPKNLDPIGEMLLGNIVSTLERKYHGE